jgi:hypothetical protein
MRSVEFPAAKLDSTAARHTQFSTHKNETATPVCWRRRGSLSLILDGPRVDECPPRR